MIPSCMAHPWSLLEEPHPAQQNSDCVSKVVKERTVRKVVLVVFWDATRVVHKEFVPQGRSVNARFYFSS